MKITDILFEQNAQIVFPHKEDASRVARFKVVASPTSLNNIIKFIPATSKDLDKLEGVEESDALAAVVEYAEKHFDGHIKFIPLTHDYGGVGYAIKIDLEPIMKTLNK